MEDSIRVLYKKFLDGDSMTDEEMKRLYLHVSDTANNLFELGPMFHVSFVYLHKHQLDMEVYLSNRGVEFTQRG